MATIYFGNTLIDKAVAPIVTSVVSCTKLEYETLAFKDPNTLYVLTDVEDQEVQSDWNQNDESAPDYVKNRFGGYYTESYTEIVPDTTISVTAWTYKFKLQKWGASGTIWDVTFDSVVYRGEFVMRGADNIFVLEDDAPFSLSGTEKNGYYLNCSVEGTHTYSIKRVSKIPATIDEKFLPDTVATKEYVDSAIGANKDVFFAIYGTTTLSDILTAYTSGKNIVCSYPDKNLFASLTKVQAAKWVPAAVDGTSYTGETVTIPSINMMPTEFEYVVSAVDQYRVTTATGVYPFSFGDADEVIVAKSDTSIVEGLSITRNGNLMGFQSDNWDAMGSKTAALKIESLANTSVDGSDVECTVTFSAALDNTIVILILSADGSWSSTSSKLADVEYVDSAIGAAIGGSY